MAGDDYRDDMDSEEDDEVDEVDTSSEDTEVEIDRNVDLDLLEA
jgi:hypothetical protein